MPNFSQLFSGGGLKSVQRGKTTIPAATPSLVVNVGAVNMGKARLTLLGFNGDTINNVLGGMPLIELINSSQIRASIGAASDRTVTFSWELAEFI